jgi:hypothetical protein
MSPELLLVILIALLTASIAGLITRRPFYYLPIYWVLGVSALLLGQVVGRAAGVTALTIGDVEAGVGLLINGAMIAGLHLFALWYNQDRR